MSVYSIVDMSAYKGQKRLFDPFDLEFQALVSHLTWCWVLKSGSLQVQQVLLTAESDLQSQFEALLLNIY